MRVRLGRWCVVSLQLDSGAVTYGRPLPRWLARRIVAKRSATDASHLRWVEPCRWELYSIPADWAAPSPLAPFGAPASTDALSELVIDLRG